MSTLLVTGGAGFIGSNLIRYLLEATSFQIVNCDCLTYAGNLESLAEISDDPRYRFSPTDIVDAEATARLIADCRPDAVIHLAAESHVDRSIDGPGAFIQTNVVGTYNLLQASLDHFRKLEGEARSRFRFHHVSTDEVYGSLSPDGEAFCESTPYDPHSPYSASKAASDHLVRAWSQTYGLPTLITNCSNNYGPCQFPEKLVPVVILNAIHGQSIPVYGDGQNIRDWLYVTDHAKALLRVLQSGRPGETYNIGGNQERTNLDLVKLICRLLNEELPPDRNPRFASRGNDRPAGYEALITFVADRPGHDRRYAIDTTKISTELDWAPEEDLESGFRKTIRWYLDHEPWWQHVLSGEYRIQRQGLGSGRASNQESP